MHLSKLLAPITLIISLAGCGTATPSLTPSPALSVTPRPASTPETTPTAASLTYPMRLEQVSQFGGSAEALALSGDTVYLKDGPRLDVIDVSNPWQPVRVGQSDALPGPITAIAALEPYVLVGDERGTLWVFDVSDKGAPRTVASLEFAEMITRIVLDGQLAYLGLTQHGLRIVDLADPLHPELKGQIDLGWVREIAVRDGAAFVLTYEDELISVDVTDPRYLSILSTMPVDGYNTGLALNSNTLYAGDNVYDVTDPVTPQLIATNNFGNDGGAISGTLIFSYSNRWGIHINYPILEVYDFSDPQHPVEVNTPVELPPGRVATSANIAVRDRILFLGAAHGLEIYDLSVPPVKHIVFEDIGSFYPVWSRIAFLRTLHAEIYRGCCASTYSGNLDVIDGYLYTFTPDTTSVWSLEDPANPRLLHTLTRQWSLGTGFKFDGGFIFQHWFFNPGYYVLIDTRDPANPTTTNIPLDGEETTVQGITGSMMVVCGVDPEARAGSNHILLLYDISDPYHPTFSSRYGPVPDCRYGLSLDGTIVTMVKAENKPDKLILDITDPHQPRVLDTLPPITPPARDYRFDLSGESLFVYSHDDPTHPATVVPLPDFWHSDFKDDCLMLFGDSGRRKQFAVVDLHDPLRPQVSAPVETDAELWVTAGGYFYGQTPWDGIYVYKLVPN